MLFLKKYGLYILVGLVFILVCCRVLNASALVSVKNKLMDTLLESEKNKETIKNNNEKIEEKQTELVQKQAEVNNAELDELAKKLNDRYKK